MRILGQQPYLVNRTLFWHVYTFVILLCEMFRQTICLEVPQRKTIWHPTGMHPHYTVSFSLTLPGTTNRPWKLLGELPKHGPSWVWNQMFISMTWNSISIPPCCFGRCFRRCIDVPNILCCMPSWHNFSHRLQRPTRWWSLCIGPSARFDANKFLAGPAEFPSFFKISPLFSVSF